MIKRNNKKGFTIVELVIVIAVIAILAAVLIPTFAGIIRKANISADTQLVKNMNTALAADEAINGKPEDFNDVIAIVRDAGYVLSAFNPTTEGCYVAWDKDNNQLLLIDGKNDKFEVIYSANENYGDADTTWYFAVDSEEAKKALEDHYGVGKVTIKMAISSVEDLGAVLDKGGEQTIYIDESVVISKDNLLVFDVEGANTTIDLGSASLNTSGILVQDGANIVPVEVQKGTVTLNGGYISTAGAGTNAEDLPIAVALRTRKDTNVTIVGTTFENTNSAGQIKIGGTATLKDVVINSTKVGVETYFNGQLTLENVTIRATKGNENDRGAVVWSCNYDHESFEGGKGHGGNSLITINSGTYVSETAGTHGAIVSCGGSVVINGGNFTAVEGEMFNVQANGGTITITGGTFNGVAFADVDDWNEYCDSSCKASVSADGKTVTISAK